MNIIYLEKLGNLIIDVNNFKQELYHWGMFKESDKEIVESFYKDYNSRNKDVISKISIDKIVSKDNSLEIIGSIYFLINKIETLIDEKYYGVNFSSIDYILKLAEQLSDDLFIAINE
jgi:hypothetical protein